MFSKFYSYLFLILVRFSERYSFIGRVCSLVTISNLFKVLVIFSFGFISRLIVNWWFGINVFVDYTEPISILYYLSFSVFIVTINDLFVYCIEEGLSSLVHRFVGIVSKTCWYLSNNIVDKMVMFDGCSHNWEGVKSTSKGLSLYKDPDKVQAHAGLTKSGSRSKGYTSGQAGGSSATSNTSRFVNAVIMPVDDSTKDNTLRHQKRHSNLRGSQSKQVRVAGVQQVTNPGLVPPVSSEQNSIDSARPQIPFTGNLSHTSLGSSHVGCFHFVDSVNAQSNRLNELKSKVRGVYSNTKVKFTIFKKTFMWFVDSSTRSNRRN